MQRMTKWIAVGLLAGCGGDDSTITGGDSGTSSSAGDSSSDGSDVSVDSSAGPESSSSATEPGTSSGAPDDTSSSSTGGGAICGDGIVDATEECDDDNELDGDACSSTCTTTFELVWTVSYDGVAHSFDDANDVLVGPDDTLYVVGATRSIVASSDVWVQQVMADGTLGWMFTWDGPDGLLDQAGSAAWTADGDIVLVGTTESVATVEDILVMVLDPETQQVVWTQTYDGPGSGPGDNDDYDYANDVAIDPDGNIVVAGRVRIGPSDFDIWLGEYTPDGMELRWTQTYAGELGGWDSSEAVVVDDAGDISLIGFREGVMADEPIVLFFDDEGMPQDADTIELESWVNDLARNGDGTLALVGYDVPANTGADLRVSVRDSEWTEQWFQFHANFDTDIGEAVAIDAMGRVAAAGWQQIAGQSANAWVGGFREDGTPWWGDSYNNDDADLNEFYNGVAIDSAGDVIAVGLETVLGQQSNVFIRKYHPL